MLKQIENSFLTSNRKVKFQLFVLPIFFIYFYIYFFVNTHDLFIDNSNKKLNSLQNKKFLSSYLLLTKDLEEYCKNKKIKLKSISYNKNNLLLKGVTSLSKIDNLIKKIEGINNFSKITSLSVIKAEKKNTYIFVINTQFKKYYIKDKQEKIKTPIQKKKNTFNLKAIIADHVLLNNKWYTTNDIIGKYKIIRIAENSVLLKYKDKNINLKLHKNE